ncbi:MAG: type III secretion system export apparatus subunit SctT [Roseicyclus sp.]|jgi:type III secretion protein T|nr:type III secretion system export apparatus subunit SctT [Roseicyclus sp.]
MEQVSAMFREGAHILGAFLLCLPRAYAFVAVSQLLAPTAVPRMARNVAILVIALPLTPLAVPFAGSLKDNLPLFMILFAKEVALGFVMGFLVFWIFWSMQAAGNYIDNQRGAAIAASIDPLQGHEASPLGILFSQAFITYFFSVGGFLILIGALYDSYLRWPLFETLPLALPEFPALILGVLDRGMFLTVLYAGPVIVIMFLVEFALALVSRFAPQIQVFILAMPIKSAVAILILIFYVPLLFDYGLEQGLGFRSFFDEFYAILEAGRDLR